MSQLMSLTSRLFDSYIPIYFSRAYLVRSFLWPLVPFEWASNWEKWIYTIDFVHSPISVSLCGRMRILPMLLIPIDRQYGIVLSCIRPILDHEHMI